MTIPEAAQLVLQASALANGGEVFLLDMGKPIKIYDLAVQMISLSGLKIKDKNRKDGDIEIKITGERPGEKLYEELLIDAKAKRTSHELIYKAEESFIKYTILSQKLEQLEEAISKQKIETTLNILNEIVPEWVRSNTTS